MIYEIIKFNKVALNLLSSKNEISLETFLNQNNLKKNCMNYNVDEKGYYGDCGGAYIP